MTYNNFLIDGKKLQMNDEQHAVIVAPKENDMLILSCAGSGKSTTMICRVKYLLDNGVPPEKIILTTFNVDAAEGLKNKIKSMMGTIPSIMLGTFDSIACRLYHKYFKKEYNVCISEYTTELVKYLQSEDGTKITSKFKYIIFDEFQDVNETQFQVIKNFYDNGVKVILIGDDAQNIYQWRGSNIKYILTAKSYFPTIKTYNLSINYRSSAEIIELANNVIINNKDSIKKDMISNIGSSGMLPIVKYYYNLSYQSSDIVKEIAAILSLKEANNGDIAVLSRNNFPLEQIEVELEKYNNSHQEKIKYISLFSNNESSKPKIDPECVTLSTIHKSKGLEWKIVFLIGCDDKNFPSNLDAVGIQEERRLFYVAITRAKKILKITFTGRNITRFLGEVPRTLYTFPNYNKKFYEYTNQRFHKTEEHLDKVINGLKESDIDNLRDINLIPTNSPTVIKIHDNYSYTDEINKIFLQSDLNNFISRYTTRVATEKNIKKNKHGDHHAKLILQSIPTSRDIYTVYSEYGYLINMHLKELNGKSNADVINILNSGPTKIESRDEQHVIELVKFILDMGEKYNETEMLIIPEQYLPQEYMDGLTSEYEIYSDPKTESSKILKHIYQISLCENICDGRRRLIYQDVYDTIVTPYKNLLNDIEHKYVPILSDSFESNKYITSRTHVLDCIIDFYDASHQNIIDIHCSNETDCKINWILQLLGKIALIKYLYGVDIKSAQIYNPLLGTITTFDTSEWIYGETFLQYLCNIRMIPIIEPEKQTTEKPKNNDKNKITRSKQLIHATPDIPLIPLDGMEHNDTKMINNLDVYDMMIEKIIKLMHDMKLLIEKSKKIEDEIEDIKLEYIMRVNRDHEPYYIVFDTETTGLPIMCHGHIIDVEKKLSNYDHARLLQLSWAVYDIDGKLIKVEDHYVKPIGYRVGATEIHGITQEIADAGEQYEDVVKLFYNDFITVEHMFGHNVAFDINIMKSEMIRHKQEKYIKSFDKVNFHCTATIGKDIMDLKRRNGTPRYPKQKELFKHVVGRDMCNAHNSKYDVLNLGEIVSRLVANGTIDFDEFIDSD